MNNWTPKDYEYMQLAIEQAELAIKHHDQPFGAVIVKDNQIIGSGKSQDTSGGTVIEHAEVMALIEACQKTHGNNLRGAIIYTTNEPCPMCAAAIFQAKIDRVICGLLRTELPMLIRNRKIRVFDLADDSGYPIEIEHGLMKTEIMALFDQFFNKTAKS